MHSRTSRLISHCGQSVIHRGTNRLVSHWHGQSGVRSGGGGEGRMEIG